MVGGSQHDLTCLGQVQRQGLRAERTAHRPLARLRLPLMRVCQCVSASNCPTDTFDREGNYPIRRSPQQVVVERHFTCGVKLKF